MQHPQTKRAVTYYYNITDRPKSQGGTKKKMYLASKRARAMYKAVTNEIRLREQGKSKAFLNCTTRQLHSLKNRLRAFLTVVI